MSAVAPTAAPTDAPPPVLIVPGLRDHVAEHWQTHLAHTLGQGAHTLAPLQADRLSCAAQVAALDQALAALGRPALLVAHSAGCLTVAHWARHHRRPVHAALLVAPPDFDAPLPAGYPDPATLQTNGWLPVPRARLPFRSQAVLSSNDPLSALDRAQALAAGWGSEVLLAGAVGHLNPAAGYGPWDRAQALVHALF